MDDYKNIQEVAYSLLVNSIKKNKLSHAYLINANNYDKCYDFVKAFIKTIICDNNKTSYNNCVDCNKCIRIDNGSYSEFKIIEPVSGMIKKEQLDELQKNFSTEALESNYRIYIIYDADKLNVSAANSLLKFLEEPTDNIVAILVTNSFSKVMSTIVSRCQVINLINIKEYHYDTTLENINAILVKEDILSDMELIDKYELLINNIIDFLIYVEENGIDTLIYMKKLWYNNFSNRDDFALGMQLIEYFYYDILKNKSNISDYFFADRLDDISRIAILNSVESIIKKIDLINYAHEMSRNNLNLNLLIDDVVIKLGECNEKYS